MTIKKDKYSNPLFKYIKEFLLFAVLLVIDLVSKQLIFAFLDKQPNKSYVVLDKIFTLVEAKNYGASFSVLSGQTTLLIVITSIVCVALGAFLLWKRDTPKTFRVALIVILGGAVGNVIDRMAFGYVRDFIDYTFLYTFFKIDFAIGNIADIFLMVGLFLLIVYIFFEYKEGDIMSKKEVIYQSDLTRKEVKEIYKQIKQNKENASKKSVNSEESETFSDSADAEINQIESNQSENNNEV